MHRLFSLAFLAAVVFQPAAPSKPKPKPKIINTTPAAPARRKAEAAPSGASAKCRDGTYSFSAHRRGTCSHHGGVATWL